MGRIEVLAKPFVSVDNLETRLRWYDPSFVKESNQKYPPSHRLYETNPQNHMVFIQTGFKTVKGEFTGAYFISTDNELNQRLYREFIERTEMEPLSEEIASKNPIYGRFKTGEKMIFFFACLFGLGRIKKTEEAKFKKRRRS